jgi:osmotically-inducible protein OsmY
MPDTIIPRTLPAAPLGARSSGFCRPPRALLALGFLTLGLAGAVSSCIPVVLGGAAAGGYAAGQERGVNGTARDAAIKLKINDQWAQHNMDILSKIDLNVFEGRVLLTGAVPNPDIRLQAVQLAWQVDGVKEVIDEIQIAQQSTFTDTARDNWIQTRLRSELVFDGQVRSLNYSLETVNGVVYVLGVARTQAEADIVLNYARNTPSVRRVVNYIRIREGEPGGPRASDPQTVKAPGGTAPAQNPGAQNPEAQTQDMPPPSAGYATPAGPSGRPRDAVSQDTQPTPPRSSSIETAPIEAVPQK